ncbi:uncharacterized protein LOC135084808 [Ostrinia nubilalis]|uniref:uncharacterized protein LOC135084808 n=1 Tax=Ostrinia nubilalis TaxID=29057 RepID=UPI0030823397
MLKCYQGRRRRPACIKQDSGIACADDCPDCCDNDHGGQDGLRKSESVEIEEQIYYCRCPERKEKPKYISLSRTDSDDKAEPSGPELIYFLKETLNKNGRDRVTLLRIEKELHALVNDSMRCIVRFPVMSSYGRMLVHRCAALFQLAHHPDPMNKNQVVVSKSGACLSLSPTIPLSPCPGDVIRPHAGAPLRRALPAGAPSGPHEQEPSGRVQERHVRRTDPVHQFPAVVHRRLPAQPATTPDRHRYHQRQHTIDTNLGRKPR